MGHVPSYLNYKRVSDGDQIHPMVESERAGRAHCKVGHRFSALKEPGLWRDFPQNLNFHPLEILNENRKRADYCLWKNIYPSIHVSRICLFINIIYRYDYIYAPEFVICFWRPDICKYRLVMWTLYVYLYIYIYILYIYNVHLDLYLAVVCWPANLASTWPPQVHLCLIRPQQTYLAPAGHGLSEHGVTPCYPLNPRVYHHVPNISQQICHLDPFGW